MDGFTWNDNAQEMFDKVVAASQFFVRHFTRSALVSGLQARGCGAVTEQLMFDVCREKTPSAFLEQTLKLLEDTRTTEAHR